MSTPVPRRGARNGRAQRIATWRQSQSTPRTAREVLDAIRPTEPTVTIDAVCASLAALADRRVALRVGVLSGQTRWTHAQAITTTPTTVRVTASQRRAARPQPINFAAPTHTVESPDPKADLREQIARDIRAFQRAGGKVQVLASDATSHPLKHDHSARTSVPYPAYLRTTTRSE